METLGYNVILFPFLLFVLKVVNIRAECESIPSMGENRVLTHEPGKPPYLNGSTATFRCSSGYNAVNFRASKSIMCIDGQWTELKLQCQKRSCGSLPDIPNGKFLLEQGIEFGATAVAQCNMGYYLVGQQYRHCEPRGWSGRNPTCEAVKCLEPPSIVNGELEDVSYELYEYGQAVTYRCKRGFTLIGQATISCSINGTFHPSPPQCLDIACEKPNIPNGKRVEGTMPPYKYKSSLRYECQPGYKMNGSGTMICEISGWVPPLVNCTVITCPAPPGIENGRINEPLRDVYTYGQAVTYSCNEGFKLIGASKRTCSGDETFQPSPPLCQERSCGSLPDIPNGKFLLEQGIEFGATAVAQCNMGYYLVGQQYRHCEHAGWSGRNPTCEAVKCLEPPSIVNGELEDVSYELYEYGQAVTYRCKRGFTLIGQATISCSINGTFHPSPPQCLDIACEKPNIPNGKRVEGTMPPYKYKSSLRYECQPGYKMNGSGTMICEISGWVPPLVNCTVITCPAPPGIENGRINEPLRDVYTYGQTVTYSCNEGFKLIGASKRTCSGDETFQPSPPLCQVMKCLRPHMQAGQLEPDQESYEYGQEVIYHCKILFYNRASKAVCSDEGDFIPTPHCVGHYGILLFISLVLLLLLVAALVYLMKKKKQSTRYSLGIQYSKEESSLK
ncbi:hypothetical protein SRHO_G00145080 [Serrasalmus rhombeus]